MRPARIRFLGTAGSGIAKKQLVVAKDMNENRELQTTRAGPLGKTHLQLQAAAMAHAEARQTRVQCDRCNAAQFASLV